MPTVMMLGDGAFGKCLGHEDRALEHGTSVPIKQKPTMISNQFQQVMTQASAMNQKEDSLWTVLALPASRIMKNNWRSISYSICSILL